LPDLTAELFSALVETPPLTLKDGGIIRQNFSPELDELLALSSEGHSWVANYQLQQQDATGIKTLKVRHNRIHGFYIEISKGQTHLAPTHYQRRQTLVNAERYTTPELTDYEHKILGAQDKANALQYQIFCELRERILAHLDAIQTTAAAIAHLDVLSTFARVALDHRYTRPQLHDADALTITNGRHPIIEQLPDAEPFIPNDTRLDNTRHQICLITGPNMAGKSTYIRQVALIAILAHIGSFVPADAALIPLLDRIFTRVGAGDDLSQGRSTFMVEMQETANILNNATPRSLLVLDEIGRGTSTFDGISIAWAVAEHLHNTPACKAKTLFATHYHELTDLALTLNGVRNYTVQIHEQGHDITFLRKIIPGAADKSYGLHVARLAGLPRTVITRAREILTNLEDDELNPASGLPSLARRNKKTPPPDTQLTLL
jgi:DNA mismatch repair protein MutS